MLNHRLDARSYEHNAQTCKTKLRTCEDVETSLTRGNKRTKQS